MVKTKKELQAMLVEVLMNRGVSIVQIKDLMGYKLNRDEEQILAMMYKPLKEVLGARSDEIAKLEIEDFELKVKQEK